MSQTPAIKVEGLTVAYDASPALWNVDLQIGREMVMGLVGPNGAGKSTLLKAILNLVPRITGRISILGKPYSPKAAPIGYVPQKNTVDWDFPVTVFDLVLMGTYGQLGWFRWPGKREKNNAIAALERLEIRDLANRQINELSGGQQQRAFLARAFVQDTSILFLDEPFAGVDVTTEKAIVGLLHELRDQGKTIVVVHHDLSTVAQYLDQVTLLNRKVVSSGPIEKAFTEELIAEAYCSTCSFAPSHAAVKPLAQIEP